MALTFMQEDFLVQFNISSIQISVLWSFSLLLPISFGVNRSVVVAEFTEYIQFNGNVHWQAQMDCVSPFMPLKLQPSSDGWLSGWSWGHCSCHRRNVRSLIIQIINLLMAKKQISFHKKVTEKNILFTKRLTCRCTSGSLHRSLFASKKHRNMREIYLQLLMTKLQVIFQW